MIKLNLEKLSFLELLENYNLLVERHSKDIDEINQYLAQMIKVGTRSELSMLVKYLPLNDSSRAEVTEAIKNRQ